MSQKIHRGVARVPLNDARGKELDSLVVGGRVIWFEGLPDNTVTLEGCQDLISRPLFVVDHRGDVKWDDDEDKVPWNPFSKLSWE